ncbi:Putative protein-S-isoprenylcysteine methyltransferase [Jannaschia seosinensis]|uniref:Steroid 5-alpha reductase C-terminal domain-containing protein n=1 Tax=Jannaschia seosinensis TaxID=313367 RepID=A0A0M7B7S2_9RHOB|nr:isoprenylcysteine carboxylmethyltransferase family protein [Jannaschia seosinensis]CUH26229.1 Putative protein-S-isoprenylcysteine methyltransferase [Jannaschia seosinensis]
MSVRRDFPDLPPVWAASILIIQILAAWIVPVVQFEADVLGWVVVAAGFALILWSALWFLRRRTTIEPRQTPTTLIVEGPFRLNRNPIYSGMALILIGAGLLLGALSAVLLALVFPPVVTRRFIVGEERDLRAAFGDEAERYISTTRRW